LPELGSEILRNRRKTEVCILLSLGSTEVTAKDNFGTLFDEVANGRERRHDSGIVGNCSILEGYIKGAAHEHTLPREIDVFDSLGGHNFLD
jgi:hypothetical protein